MNATPEVATENPDDVIEVPEVLKMLGGISRGTLYARIDEGAIKPLPKPAGAKRNPRLKFKRSVVLDYIKEQGGEAQ